jgi:tetratricopeptide (TPR) repeat protein
MQRRITEVKKLIYIAFLCICTTAVHAQLNTDRITAIGRNALYFEDYVLSIQYFNQVIHLKPYLSEPYLYRAIAKIQLEDYQGALRDCNDAIERNPFSPSAYYTRGYVYRQLELFEQSEKDYTQALHFSPENKTYMLLRADTRALMERYQQALEDVNQLLKREPQSASIWSEKGRVCLLKGDTICALEAFTYAAEYDRTNPALWSALGLIHLMLKNDDQAYTHLTQAINLGSKWAGDYINRGIIAYRRHNYRGALADYSQAVKIAPNDADCYYNRGVMRQEVGDYNNALDDLNKAISLAPQKTEMRYQRGLIEMQLRKWKEVISDMDSLIQRFPYFLPAYYMAAQAYTQIGNQVDAFKLRQKAQELEARKDEIQAQQAMTPNTDLLIANAQPQKKDYRKEFSASTAQNNRETTEEEQKYTSHTRGSVQKKWQEVVNEPNIVLTYYHQDLTLRRTNYYYPSVNYVNKQEILPTTLRFATQELALTAEMVEFHFAEISRLSKQIEQHETYDNKLNSLLAPLYWARAIEFAIVQDYTSAIDDCTRAALHADKQLQPLIYFCRANWRYRLLEYQRAIGELQATNAMDFDIMLKDYDQVIKVIPDFSFAYYNKANILCTRQEWKDAIRYYTLAIEQDNEFAEAYFNRGLTYIYTGEIEKGLHDLSKAGELGIYQAYNMITRFQ